MIEELKKRLEKGVVPVYLVLAPYPRLVDEAVSLISDAVLAGGSADFNRRTFLVGADDLSPLLRIAGTLPMMTQRRCIIVRHCENLSAKKHADDLERVNKVAKEEISTCTLIVAGSSFNKRNTVARRAKAMGGLVELGKMNAMQLQGWIKRLAAEREKDITSDAAEFLQQEFGQDLARMESEIEKASLFVGPGRRTIKTDDIREVMVSAKFENIFALMDAVGTKAREKALFFLHAILDGGRAPIPLHASIYSHMEKLFRAAALAATGMDVGQVTKALGGSPYYAGKIVSQSRRFSRMELRRALITLSKTDFDLKNSRTSDRAVLERMILDLLRSKAP